jgi:hypothetical protein
MKKQIIAGAVVAATLIAGQAQAAEKKAGGADSNGDGKICKAEFCAAREKAAEKAGKDFDKAAVEKQFAARDKDKDGFLSGDEMPSKKPAAKKEGGEKKADADDE